MMRWLSFLATFLLLAGPLAAADLRQSPEIGRGIAVDGGLPEALAQELHRRGVTVAVFRFGDTAEETLETLAGNVKCAAGNGLQSVVLYEPGPAEADIEANWRRLLNALAPVEAGIRGYGLASGKHAAAYEARVRAFLPEFRKFCPDGWLVFQPGDFGNLEALPDRKVTYTARIDAATSTEAILAFLKKSGAPFLASFHIEDPKALIGRIHEVDGKNWSWYSIPAGRSFSEELEFLHRPFLKGAGFDERYSGLARDFQALRRPGSLNFAFITDTHYQLREEGRTVYGGTSVESMRNMARMAKELKLDFVCNAGDMVDGNSPREVNLKEIRASVDAMRSSGLPVFVAIGNHDDGTYYCRDHVRDGSEAVTNAQWRAIVVEPVLGPAVADDRNPEGNYFYCDFPDRKIRVVVLACCDNPLIKNEKGELKYFSISKFIFRQPQLEWLATKALNFSDKADAREWSVLFITHAPPENGVNGNVVQQIIKAFQDGTPCRPEPTANGDFPQHISCDFSGQGPMRVLALLHGHYHSQYMADKFGYMQIGFLNGLCYRNSPNHPPRAIDTPDMECWTLISIDPADNRITGLRFGAGNDFQYELPAFKPESR